MDDSHLDKLFTGDLDRLASLPKRVVRLFISSTFTDMTIERNILMERVYPKMKRYCRDNYSLDFQMVDMRWGIRDEATDDHKTVDLCNREIDNCQRISLGPNFIALIGDKYGYRPLPNKIVTSELRSLRRSLIESDVNTDLLDFWYKEDTNSVPAEHVLQPISTILKNFTNKNEPDLQTIDQRIWQAIQERLHELLLMGSQRLVQQGRMSEQDRLMRYSISVTEREVINGCLNVNRAKHHCLVYVRSITRLHEHCRKCLEHLNMIDANNGQLRGETNQLSPLKESGSRASPKTIGSSVNGPTTAVSSMSTSLKIGQDLIRIPISKVQTASGRKAEKSRRLFAKFLDLKTDSEGGWQIDGIAQEALHSLRNQRLPSKLSADGKQFRLFRVDWQPEEGISSKSEEHKRYLNELSDHLYKQLCGMIRNSVKEERKSRTMKLSGLVGEILQHAHYAKRMSQHVFGRLSELEQMKSYILQDIVAPSNRTCFNKEHLACNKLPRLPMFVYGVSGCGKTSVLARVALDARDWVKVARNRRSSTNQLLEQYLALHGRAQPITQSRSNDKIDREPCIIIRFCCTTSASSSVIGLLTSICRQLQYNFYQYGSLNGICADYNLNEGLMSPSRGKHGGELSKGNLAATQQQFAPLPGDFVRLVFVFHRLLENCRHPLHRRRVFIIIIDSIERLKSPTDSDLRAKFSWLTAIKNLPPNVKLIVSCSSSIRDSKDQQQTMTDFAHLKRHFLIVCSNLYRENSSDTSSGRRGSPYGRSSERSSSADTSTSSSLDSSEDIQETQRAISDSLKRAGHSMLVPSGEQDSLSSSSYKFRMLKRLIWPAMRFIRQSRADIHKDLPGINSIQPKGVSFATSGNRLLMMRPEAEMLGRRKSVDMAPSDLSAGQDGLASNHGPALTMLHLKPLGKEIARKILANWLKELGRGLTKQQWSIVERSFSHCSRPIFIKLTLGEVINWKSYSSQGDTSCLTFGSSWLREIRLAKSESEDSIEEESRVKLSELIEQDEENYLLSLAGDGPEDFQWQTLMMEQQWLNFIEYKQRKDQSRNFNSPGVGMGGLVVSINSSGSSSRQKGNGRGAKGLNDTEMASSATSMVSSSWSSSGSLCHLSDTIEDAICQLFARIELQHGYLLTKHCLSYINAARSGICENELEDILSLDDIVLDDVFQYHLPPVRRIPPLLWTRIRNDLNDYLSERDSDGIVIGWHYEQFRAVTERRYLSDPAQLNYIHSSKADYFIGIWADKAKPFRCTKQQLHLAAEQLDSAIQQSLRDSQQGRSSATGTSSTSVNRLGSGSGLRSGASFSVRNRLRSSDQHDHRLQWMQAKADRRVPHQPLFFSDSIDVQKNLSRDISLASSDGGRQIQAMSLSFNSASSSSSSRRRYNRRKIIELPYHLMHSGRFSELASIVLFNYQWLSAAINSIGLQNLLSDFVHSSEFIAKELQTKRDLKLAAARRTEEKEEANQRESSEGIPALDVVARDAGQAAMSSLLSENSLESLQAQVRVLHDTLRLSGSVLNTDPLMLAPQLLGRLVSLVEQYDNIDEAASSTFRTDSNILESLQGEKNPIQAIRKNWLRELLDQCRELGSADCASLPETQCLQSADGLQLSSLESHTGPFGVTSMCLTSDMKQLLTGANNILMWNIGTGEVIREYELPSVCSCIAELQLSADGEIAIAYSRENNIIAISVQKQKVALLNCSDLKPGSILGLRLIDSLGGKLFYVWTKSGWKRFKLVEVDIYNNSNQDLDEWARIELESEYDLYQKHDTILDQMPDINSVNIVGEYRRGCELIILIIEAEKRMRLVTLEYGLSGTGDGKFETPKLWEENCEMYANLICLSDDQRQVVFADFRGNVYLRRRRARSWSRPKLIRVARRIDLDDTKSELLKAIEMEPNMDLARSKNEDEDLCYLEDFERKVDGLIAEANDSGSVFSSSKNEKEESNVKGGIKFLKVYLTSAIVVVRLDRRHTDTELKYMEHSCALPRDIKNVNIRGNESQTKSLIIDYESRENYYLIAAVSKRILIYQLEKEQLLRSIEAHEARISKILPIISSRERGQSNKTLQSNPDFQTIKSIEDRKTCIASASIDRSVRIWNLNNIGGRSMHLS